MKSHGHLLKKSAQHATRPANANETDVVPLNLQSTESMSPQNILRLQHTIGNAATQRALNTDSATNSVVASRGLIGNAGIQRMLNRLHTSGITVQRQLDFAPGQLTGKTAKSGLKKFFDNPHASTFREIEEALASFHKTARDDYPKLQQYLTTIIEKSDVWLNNIDHLSTSNEEKRISLEKLREAARVERRRVIITKEIGVPYQIVDTFGAAQVEDFWKIVTALDAKQPQVAMAHFTTYQGYLGGAIDLVKQFMMRNQVHVFNPQLATSMNTADFRMDPKKGDGAKQLIVNEAKAKLAEYKRLQDKFDAEMAAFQAELKKNPNKKQTDYKMLDGVSEESRALGMLKLQKDQYQGIVDGTTIRKKQKEIGLEGLSEAELYGIVGYTSNLYSTINSGLRENTADQTKFTGDHVELSEAMTSGLNKLKPYKGRVFRHNGDFTALSLVNVQDAIVVEIAPTSTAVSQQACASAGENHGVLEIFESINGKDVSKASVFGSGEQEILFAPGTRFKVIAAFARKETAWGTPHHRSQYDIDQQKNHPLFEEAMKLAEKDAKKNAFHRIIFKNEVK